LGIAKGNILHNDIVSDIATFQLLPHKFKLFGIFVTKN